MLLAPVCVGVAGIEPSAVDGDLGEPCVADDPDHRAVRIALILATVDGAFGEQRAALVDLLAANDGKRDMSRCDLSGSGG